MTGQQVCEECGYNLPFHAETCARRPRTRAFCPEHTPDGVVQVGSDDGRATCLVCGTTGYHVGRFITA